MGYTWQVLPLRLFCWSHKAGSCFVLLTLRNRNVCQVGVSAQGWASWPVLGSQAKTCGEVAGVPGLPLRVEGWSHPGVLCCVGTCSPRRGAFVGTGG